MKKILLMGTAVSAVLVLQTASALADAAAGIETVTVTAERRAENLQKTPVSVQVLSRIRSTPRTSPACRNSRRSRRRWWSRTPRAT